MDKYNKRGVSSKKEDVHNALQTLDKGLYPNAFCKITPDLLGNDKDYCNIMHADGATLSLHLPTYTIKRREIYRYLRV